MALIYNCDHSFVKYLLTKEILNIKNIKMALMRNGRDNHYEKIDHLNVPDELYEFLELNVLSTWTMLHLHTATDKFASQM